MPTPIIDLIRQGKTREAFVKLQEAPLSVDRKRSLSVLEAEFNELQQQELKGILTAEEKQLRKNRINDRLLAFAQELHYPRTRSEVRQRNRNLLYLLPALIVGLLLFGWWMNSRGTNTSCPDFEEPVANKVLIIPFEKVGTHDAKPQLVLRDRINNLAAKNQLSTIAKVGAPNQTATIHNAEELARNCKANVIIWGNYSGNTDSLRLSLQYTFLDQPERSKMGKLISLKDVIHLQHGEILKDLDDSIFHLCGLIAVREGKKEKAENWLQKVKEKKQTDELLLQKINDSK